MDKVKIFYLIGTRPEIIRSASIINELKNDPEVDFKLVHTGQHYDYLMDKVFFEELGVPAPDYNLEIGSGSHAEQDARIMVELDKLYKKDRPDLIAVFGDTNSSLAAAITSVKLEIPVAHLEAGCREYEMDMPEEINRKLIDHCSRVLLPVSQLSLNNLNKENVSGDSFFVGDPLYDVFKAQLPKVEKIKEDIIKKYGVEEKNFVLLTTHRGKNVDDKEKLESILEPLSKLEDTVVIFPAHPRTKNNISNFGLNEDLLHKLIIVEPVPYLEILALVSESKFVVTDSGGLQKEVFWLKKPSITIRDHTAWSETVDAGTNLLCKPDKCSINEKVQQVEKNYESIIKKFETVSNPYINKETRDITKDSVKLLKEYARKPW